MGNRIKEGNRAVHAVREKIQKKFFTEKIQVSMIETDSDKELRVKANLKEGEEYTDGDGKVWYRTKTGTLMNKSRPFYGVPMFCPSCEIVMGGRESKLNNKAYMRWGHCYGCQLEKERLMRVEGGQKAVDSYYENGKILTDVISQYEKEMVTMLQLFSNVVIQLNDYALENGINQETIVERNDQFNRLKEIMFKEYEKDFPVGTLFRPSKDQDNNWRKYAAQELGLTGTRGDRLYDMISSNFRFGSGYAARKYLREQRDKFKPDSNEYKKWDKKIIEL